MDTFNIYNVTSNPNWNDTNETEDNFIHHDIIYTFVCSVAIIANLFLIYCLLRFKKMRIRRNIIILNWSIADTLHMISNIFSFDLIPNVTGLYKYDEYFCGIFETRAMLHITTIIFVLWLLLDCTFKKCTRKCFLLTIICIWVIAYLGMITSVALCIYGIYLPYSYSGLLFFFAILIISCLIYSCLALKRKIKKINVDDSAFRFSAVTMYGICWLSHIICFYLSFFLTSKLLYSISKSVAITGYMNIIINLFLYAYIDRNYGICYSYAFKCDKDINVNDKIVYSENADVEFLYTSLKPPSIRNYPKPEKLFVNTQPNLGTPV